MTNPDNNNPTERDDPFAPKARQQGRPVTDPVNHPQHYADGWTNGAEVIDITEHLNFNRGNVVKYTARAGRKNPTTELEDLRKARWYLNREIARLENDQ